MIEDKSSEVIRLRNELAKSQMISGGFEAKEREILKNKVKSMKVQLVKLRQKCDILENNSPDEVNHNAEKIIELSELLNCKTKIP